MPAAFPGAVVRRSVGTPFVGYRGAAWLIQEIMNALYNQLFTFLPVDGAYAAGRSGAPVAEAAPGNLPWQPAARARLDAALERLPYMPRISASRQIQLQTEALARQRALADVDEALVDEVLAAQQQGR
jgi:chlorophyllide a reductase subunit Z